MENIDPEILAQNPTKLNQQQIAMLNLFKNPLPDEAYKEIKNHIVKVLAKLLDEEMERLEKEKGWTEETYEQFGKEHMRTTYKR